MYWLIYILSALGVSHFVASYSRRNYLIIFPILMVIFVTPAQIDVSGSSLAPSIFIFLFNLILEQKFSLRELRPFVLTLPIYLILLFLTLETKKRLFAQKDP